jgi:regulatory protein
MSEHKITDIQPQKRNKARSNIFVNEEFFVGLSDYVIAKHQLKIGKTINPSELKKMLLEEETEKAKQYVLDYQLHNPLSVIERKLREKGYEEEVSENVKTFLLKYNIIDDTEYARKFIHDTLVVKKKGKKWAIQELRKKGMEKRIIDEAIEKHWNEEKEWEVVWNLYEKKQEKIKKKAKNHFEKKRKLFQYLAQRGFDSSIIQSVMEEGEKE